MIRVNELYKRFDDQAVLSGIELEVRDGEIVVILGASGSGKSVLLRHLIGLMKPDRGRIEINGTNIVELREDDLLEVRKNIGFLFQEGALYDFMSVYDNVAFPLREHTDLDEASIGKKVRETLALVGLQEADDKMPAQLSGGMKKRAALARAIVLNSKILFCDEPTSGLDPLRSRDISDLIASIARTMHCTTVIASHDIHNSLRIADRLGVIKEGKLAMVGRAQDIRNSTDPFIKEFFSE